MQQNQPKAKRSRSLNLPTLGANIPRKHRPITHWIGLAYLYLARWQFEGDVPDIGKFVGIGAPHTSTWEVFLAIAAFWALDLDVQWLAKDSLFKWPLGILMRWAGAFPIDRSQSGGAVPQAIEQFKHREQMLLLLAPEGTRKKVDRWKRGFYHIAHGADVPILPVGIDFVQRRFVLGDLFETTGDVEADMVTIRAWFRPMQGKHPERV